MSPLVSHPFDFIWNKSGGFVRPKWMPLTSGNFLFNSSQLAEEIERIATRTHASPRGLVQTENRLAKLSKNVPRSKQECFLLFLFLSLSLGSGRDVVGIMSGIISDKLIIAYYAARSIF